MDVMEKPTKNPAVPAAVTRAERRGIIFVAALAQRQFRARQSRPEQGDLDMDLYSFKV